jgi:serine/threonine protein kinase
MSFHLDRVTRVPVTLSRAFVEGTILASAVRAGSGGATGGGAAGADGAGVDTKQRERVFPVVQRRPVALDALDTRAVGAVVCTQRANAYSGTNAGGSGDAARSQKSDRRIPMPRAESMESKAPPPLESMHETSSLCRGAATRGKATCNSMFNRVVRKPIILPEPSPGMYGNIIDTDHPAPPTGAGRHSRPLLTTAAPLSSPPRRGGSGNNNLTASRRRRRSSDPHNYVSGPPTPVMAATLGRRSRRLYLPPFYKLNSIILEHEHVIVALLDRNEDFCSAIARERGGPVEVDERAVLKQIYLSETSDERLREAALSERRAHEKVGHHQFICSCLRAFISPRGDLCMLLRYAPGGDLLQRIRKSAGDLGLAQVRLYFSQILQGIHHIHEKRVAHRDIKPENIVISHDGTMMITDFGLAARQCGWASGSGANTCCGTLQYMAPELACRRAHGMAVDMWSLGILLFEMLVGRSPFEYGGVSDKPFYIINVLRQPVDAWDHALFALPEETRGSDGGGGGGSSNLDDLLQRLLQPDPARRMTAAAALRHPFLA